MAAFHGGVAPRSPARERAKERGKSRVAFTLTGPQALPETWIMNIYVIDKKTNSTTYILYAPPGAAVRTRVLGLGERLQVYIQHPREEEVLGTYEGVEWAVFSGPPPVQGYRRASAVALPPAPVRSVPRTFERATPRRWRDIAGVRCGD